MSRVKCEVEDGLAPFEKVVHITTTGGYKEEVAVPSSLVAGLTLVTSIVDRVEKTALIELPRESVSGRWRVWVPEAALVEEGV